MAQIFQFLLTENTFASFDKQIGDALEFQKLVEHGQDARSN